MRRMSSLVAALLLQFAPLLRTVEPAMLGVLQPVCVLLRWVSAAAAVAGGAHALSGATGLVTATSVRGTNGVGLTYRAQITSTVRGTAKSYSATGLPPGMAVASATAGIISGTPTAAGTFASQVTGWQTSSLDGEWYTATLTFVIVDVPPAITTQPVAASATVGDAVTLAVTASGTGLSYRWTHDGLEVPGGTNAVLTFKAVRQADAGIYQARVLNSAGSVLSLPTALTIKPAFAAPVFSTSPAGKTVHANESVVLSAAASVATPGATISYSWTQDGAPLADASSGPNLMLRAIGPSQAGSYRAVATANGLSSTSAPASIVVVAPLSALGVAVTPAGFVVRANAIPGRRYALMGASDPAGSSWTTLSETLATGPGLEWADPGPTAANKFYRVSVAP